MTVDSVIIGLVCTLLGAAFGWAGYRRNAHKDAQAEGKSDGVMLTEIGYIKSGVDDIKLEQRLQRDDISQLKVEVAETKASTKQAHKRINDIIGRKEMREE